MIKILAWLVVAIGALVLYIGYNVTGIGFLAILAILGGGMFIGAGIE